MLSSLQTQRHKRGLRLRLGLDAYGFSFTFMYYDTHIFVNHPTKMHGPWLWELGLGMPWDWDTAVCSMGNGKCDLYALRQ